MGEPGASGGERRGRRSSLYLLQLVPLAAVVLFATACGGEGGSSADFFTGRRSDLFLRGFLFQTGNTNVSATTPPVTSIAPTTNSNGNISLANVTFNDVIAHLIIANGVSARLENIQAQFTEVDGSTLRDFNLSPPVALAGQFDFQVRSSISLSANPILTLPAPLSEPRGVATDFLLPIQLYNTGIFTFQIFQPAANVRPILARLTFTGRDIFDNPFTVVGFIILSPQVIRTT